MRNKKKMYMQSENFVMRKIADEFILIPITQFGADVQRVYSLNHSAAAIWQCLEKPVTPDAIQSKVEAKYLIDPDTTREDIHNILDIFVSNGFCSVLDES